MAKGGALKPVYIVTDDELEVNGGDFVLQQGPAMKVRGFTLDNYAGRRVQSGAAQPVYVVPEASAPAMYGDHWRVIAGQPIKVLSVTDAERNIIQGPAVPVYPVDDAGNYDSSFAGAPYYQRVLATQPGNLIAYWPLWETAGIVAEELVNGWNGTYTRNVAIMGTGAGIGDGNTAPVFNGVNDFVDVSVAGFLAAVNPDEFTVCIWTQIPGAVWVDGSVDHWFTLYQSANNQNWIRKQNVNNTYQYYFEGNNIPIFQSIGPDASVLWRHYAMLGSVAGNYLRLYVNGAQVGVTQVGLNAWTFGPTLALIGAQTVAPLSPTNGLLAHVTYWNTQLTVPQIQNLAVV